MAIIPIDSIVIYFADEISEEVLNRVTFYYKSLKSLNDNSFISIIPSYTSIYIRYDIFKFDNKSVISYINDKFSGFKSNKNMYEYQKVITIPVYYSTQLVATPRLKHPRKMIPKGSVGIADYQTAVYPRISPGGWNIIGRTPKELFNINSKDLSPFEIGFKVKFKPITKKEYLKLGGKI